jgi:uncharacterized membrane protein YdbT with pleckstrin-like domain
MDELIEPGEQQVLVVRRHWIGLAPAALSALITTILVVGGGYLLGRYNLGSMAGTAGIGLAALLVLGAILAYASLLIYRQNRLIITTKHVYLVTQLSLFSRKVAQCHLEEMQDVTVHKEGVLATLLDYGDLTIETAGEVENFVFTLAATPEALADRIMTAQQQIERSDKSPAATS